MIPVELDPQAVRLYFDLARKATDLRIPAPPEQLAFLIENRRAILASNLQTAKGIKLVVDRMTSTSHARDLASFKCEVDDFTEWLNAQLNELDKLKIEHDRNR